MRVELTAHARLRCRQQGITPAYVRKQLESAPRAYGAYNWRTRHGHELIYRTLPGNIHLVITVVSCHKKIHTYKRRLRA